MAVTYSDIDSDAKLTLSVTVLPGDPPEETPEVGETA